MHNILGSTREELIFLFRLVKLPLIHWIVLYLLLAKELLGRDGTGGPTNLHSIKRTYLLQMENYQV